MKKPLRTYTTKRLISGKVIDKRSMVGLISVEGVGNFPIPFYLLPKVKVGRYYTFTLEYSPFLNCIAIMKVKKVINFKSITDLAVDFFKSRNNLLLNLFSPLE